jgi:hypothetical protein
MAALNDTRLLQMRIAVLTNPERQPPQSPAERLVRTGETGYYGRMFLAHLYEAGQVLGALDAAAKAWVTTTAAQDSRANEALIRVRDAFSGGRKNGYYAFLGRIRNLAAFHYKDAPFRSGLAVATGDGEIVLAEYAGLNRFSVIDALLDEPINTAVKETGSPWMTP